MISEELLKDSQSLTAQVPGYVSIIDPCKIIIKPTNKLTVTQFWLWFPTDISEALRRRRERRERLAKELESSNVDEVCNNKLINLTI